MEDLRTLFESRYTWIAGFMRNVARYGKRTAMISPDEGKEWTYYSLNEEADRLANALVEDGVGKGDVVLMQLQNCPEFVFAYLACHKIGAICCPVSYRLSEGELSYNIEDSRPKVLLFGSSFSHIVKGALALSEYCPSRLVVVGTGWDESVLSYDDYVKDKPPFFPEREHNIYDETTRLYSSGTTGRTKAIPIASINEVLSAHDVMIHFPLNFHDVTMNTTPWFHRGGLHCAGPCPALYAGAAMVVMPKFEADKALEYVSKYGISFLVGVPTVLESLSAEQERVPRNISSLKGIVTMGSPLERAACIRYQKVLTTNIFNGYGTTETFWNTFLRPFDLPDHAGSAGTSCIDDDVRVVKIYEDRKAEPDDLAAMDGKEVGEVIICSPAKSPCRYFNNEKEDKSKYYKGFMYTKDLATWDGERYVTIVGRKDDMIISSGENIYPVEIEEVLNRHPKVADCVVTSVPDKIRGQLVTAYIVPCDSSLTAEELDSFCKESPYMASFKRPRYYRFVKELPFTATGKKQHFKIKKQAAEDLSSGLLKKV